MPGETVENYLLLIELARQEDTLKQMTKKNNGERHTQKPNLGETR